jgi:RNA polymerase sigma-70 factor (ECF subfamily)
MLDEQTLIISARGGQLHAFNQLVMAYQTLAYAVARRVVSDPDVAADATQDAFVKAYRKLDQYRGGSFKAWLLRIVINTCYDRLRAMRRRPSTSLENLLDQADRASIMIDPTEGPEHHALRVELRHQIEAAIADLPADQRLVIVLCDVEGYNYHEISDLVGIPLGTVKSRIARGRARLRDRLVLPAFNLAPQMAYS